MAEAAEELLIRRAQQGDRTAFGDLVQRYQGQVYAFACSLAQDPDAAADITQDVFVRAWQYLGRFDPARPLKPWLFRIAANRASTRRQRRRETVSLEELPGDPATPEVAAREAQRRELAGEVRQALLQLSPQQREAIALVELEGMTAVDAAEVMQCSPATVRQHVFRAKKRLQVLLQGYVRGAD